MHDFRVALDSQCFTYIIETMDDAVEPTDHEADEKKALMRIFLYFHGIYITETVDSECKDIQDSDRRTLHNNFIDQLIDLLEVHNIKEVESRAGYFNSIHCGVKNKNDCRILAEAEALHLTHLLSYDTKFINRLAGISRTVKLLTPTDFWKGLDIPKGATPVTLPRKSNPLSKQSWWRW